METHDVRLDLAAPRYAARPFPPYRFTPGRDPHPVADPRGHSYEPPGHSRPPVVYRPPEAWRECDEYLYGCDLYNHGYWWEAHEAWEDFWRVVPPESAQKRLLQGLIQVTACHLKLYVASEAINPATDASAHLAGVHRLRNSSAAHLHAALELSTTASLMGIELRAWPATVAEYYEGVLANDRPAHDILRFPYIRHPH